MRSIQKRTQSMKVRGSRHSPPVDTRKGSDGEASNDDSTTHTSFSSSSESREKGKVPFLSRFRSRKLSRKWSSQPKRQNSVVSRDDDNMSQKSVEVAPLSSAERYREILAQKHEVDSIASEDMYIDEESISEESNTEKSEVASILSEDLYVESEEKSYEKTEVSSISSGDSTANSTPLNSPDTSLECSRMEENPEDQINTIPNSPGFSYRRQEKETEATLETIPNSPGRQSQKEKEEKPEEVIKSTTNTTGPEIKEEEKKEEEEEDGTNIIPNYTGIEQWAQQQEPQASAKTVNHVQIEYWKTQKKYWNKETLRRSVQLGPNHLRTGESLMNLGHACVQCDDSIGAGKAYLSALKIYQGLYGDRHLSVARALDKLGLAACKTKDNLDLALVALNDALKVRFELLGPIHVDSIDTLNNIAGVRLNKKEFELAAKNYYSVFRLREKLFGRKHAGVAVTAYQLGCILGGNLGRMDEAREYLTTSLEIYQALGLENSVYAIDCKNRLQSAISTAARKSSHVGV